MPPAKTPKLSAELLEKYFETQARRKDLEREARNVKKTEDAIGDDIETALKATGKTTAVRGAFRASIIDGKPSVSWKTEVIKAIGAEAAHEIEQAANVPKRLEVTREPAKAAAKKAA